TERHRRRPDDQLEKLETDDLVNEGRATAADEQQQQDGEKGSRRRRIAVTGHGPSSILKGRTTVYAARGPGVYAFRGCCQRKVMAPSPPGAITWIAAIALLLQVLPDQLRHLEHVHRRLAS